MAATHPVHNFYQQSCKASAACHPVSLTEVFKQLIKYADVSYTFASYQLM